MHIANKIHSVIQCLDVDQKINQFIHHKQKQSSSGAKFFQNKVQLQPFKSKHQYKKSLSDWRSIIDCSKQSPRSTIRTDFNWYSKISNINKIHQNPEQTVHATKNPQTTRSFSSQIKRVKKNKTRNGYSIIDSIINDTPTFRFQSTKKLYQEPNNIFLEIFNRTDAKVRDHPYKNTNNNFFIKKRKTNKARSAFQITY